jgi:hypothetical protein
MQEIYEYNKYMYLQVILTAFLYRLSFYIDYYTQNHEIQGNTVIHEILCFLVFRDFECNNRYKKVIDIKRR